MHIFTLTDLECVLTFLYAPINLYYSWLVFFPPKQDYAIHTVLSMNCFTQQYTIDNIILFL